MKFVPTPQDYLKHMEVQAWMCNGVKVVDNPQAVEIAEEFLEKLRKEENN